MLRSSLAYFVFLLSLAMPRGNVIGQRIATGCYAARLTGWAYTDSAFAPRDPRFSVPIPPLFEKAWIFELSRKKASISSKHFIWWDSLASDSVKLWTATVMEGYSLAGRIRADTLQGILVYLHDTSPDRRARFLAYRMPCPKNKKGIVSAWMRK